MESIKYSIIQGLLKGMTLKCQSVCLRSCLDFGVTVR